MICIKYTVYKKLLCDVMYFSVMYFIGCCHIALVRDFATILSVAFISLTRILLSEISQDASFHFDSYYFSFTFPPHAFFVSVSCCRSLPFPLFFALPSSPSFLTLLLFPLSSSACPFLVQLFLLASLVHLSSRTSLCLTRTLSTSFVC